MGWWGPVIQYPNANTPDVFARHTGGPTMPFVLPFALKLAINTHGFLQVWAPSNRLVHHARANPTLRRGALAILVGLVYAAAGVMAGTAAQHGGPGWLYLIFLWTFWTTLKLAGNGVYVIGQGLSR